MLSPLMQFCPICLDTLVTTLEKMKICFFYNSNRNATNETEPFSCITSTSEEQKYTRKQRTRCHVVQIRALNLRKKLKSS